MKKLVLSAALLVAFSLTSFAADKEVSSISIVNPEPTVQDDGCITIKYRWTEAFPDEEGGMILEFNYIEFEWCF